MEAKPIKQDTPVLVVILRVMLPLVVILIAFYIVGYLVKTKPKVDTKAPEQTIWSVQSATVKISDHQPSLKLYGEAVSGRTVELRSLVAGEIIKTGQKLNNGSIVNKGEVLLQIDRFKYEGALTEAESRLAEAQARLQEIKANMVQEKNNLEYLKEQLELAERDLERAIQLAKKGTATRKLEDDRRVIVSQRRQSLDQKINSLELFKSKYDQQEAIIKRLVWGVKEAQRNLKDTLLVSPFNAYVDSVNAEVGRIVNANDRIATLFDKNIIDIQFTLSDSQYGRIIASGEPITERNVIIKWRVSEPPIEYAAKIERVSSKISSESGGIEVYARISNPLAGTPIRPGTFVEVHVPDRIYKSVARLPQTVLFERKYVYVIVNGKLEKRSVKSVGIDGNDVLLTGDLKQGDEVLVTRISAAGEGVRVKSQKKESRSSGKTSQKNEKTITNLAQKTPSDKKEKQSK